MLARWRQSAKCSAIAYSLPAAACCACFAAELTYIKVLHDLELYLEFAPNPTHHPPASHPTFVKPTHNWNSSIFFSCLLFSLRARLSLYYSLRCSSKNIDPASRSSFPVRAKSANNPRVGSIPQLETAAKSGHGQHWMIMTGPVQ